MTTKCVGLIGIGMMGTHMAANLAKAGLDLVLCDVDQAKARAVAAEIGAVAVATPALVAAKADMIVTMLPTSAVVQEVIFGADGLSDALRPGSTIIEMSSGDPNATIGFGERLAKAQVRLIDAPVSGGVPRAKSGELTIIAGGDAGVIDDAAPIFAALGSVTHVGILGAGQAMKALNNLVSAGGFLIGIEALLIGKKFGLEPDLMVDVLNSSSGMNNATQKKLKQYVLSRDFDAGGFAMTLMAKDVGVAMNVARSTKTPAPFSSLCSELWSAASNMLGPDVDHTAIVRMYESFAGEQLTEETKTTKQ